MSQIILIPQRLVPAMAGKIAPFLALVAEGSGGRMDASDYMALLRAGDRQLWVVEEGGDVLAIGLSEIVIYPKQKVCRITAVAGHERERWTKHIHDIHQWAKTQGCETMQTVMRPGWTRPLKAMGYRISHVVAEVGL